ncbi:MAG: DUF2764 family protein [Paraprevotella sp.]|nr:DUF2764 family protein [Paraprevotella sp.]
MSNYYCLVTGLPDVALDDAKLSFSVADFKEECMPQLVKEDGELMQLFYLQYDNRNLLALMANAETEQLDERGCLSRENLLEIIQAVRQDDATPQNTPAYMKAYLQAVFADEELQVALPEDVLAAYYYEYAMKCGNAFFARWFQFNLNLNNILIALTARRFGFNASSYLVGNNEVAEALRTSGARDFGLSTELAYYDELARISEMTDPVEKEKRLDLLKWNWLEEETFFHYFSLERLFAFLLKLDIVERWSAIDKEKGGAIFRKLIDDLKNEVVVPAEYKL